MSIFFLPLVPLLSLVPLLLIAVYFDFTTGKIPNWLTLPGTLLGIIFFIPWFGIHSVVEHFLGSMVVGGVWLIFWHTGIMGGGDQKLMLMVGAWLGYMLAPLVLFAVAVCGGIQSIAWVLYRRQRVPELSWRQALKTIHIPYSLAVAMGTFVVIASVYLGSEWLWIFNF